MLVDQTLQDTAWF